MNSRKRINIKGSTIHKIIFRTKTNFNTGCWEYLGILNKDKYGTVLDNGRVVKAHRFMYEFFNNIKLSPEIFVCHSCDNPCCVNPEHLWTGTCKDNLQDAKHKGRMRHSRYCSVTDETRRKLYREYMYSSISKRKLAKKYNITFGAVTYALKFTNRSIFI